MLEDAITVPEYKNNFITMEQSGYLGQAYELAGQCALSKRYKRTSDNLKEAVSAEDKKQEIDDTVSTEIKERRSSLVEVKDYIEEKLHKPLSSVDNAYIEGEYIKCCSECWRMEITDTLEKLTRNKSRSIIQKIFNSLDTVQSLNSVPNPFAQGEYYKLLTEHRKLISSEEEKILINQFKKECLEQIVDYSNSAEKELVFIEKFFDFLSSSESLQSVIAELQLEDFCRDKSSFNELLERIIKLEVCGDYGENVTALQEVAKCLQQEEDLFLIDKFREVVCSYIKPTEIRQERKIDGRLVIAVTGKNIVASEILRRLEKKISENSDIEEVRFVGADIVHIDADFRNEVWHGKNIAILTRAIRIYDKVTWDVSGEDNKHVYCSNAGTAADGHGKQGKDGHAGESGGNVLIVAEKIDNPENFTI
jgi:CRISPR/Cas system-associated endoribonuclease Cas2